MILALFTTVNSKMYDSVLTGPVHAVSALRKSCVLHRKLRKFDSGRKMFTV